MASPLIQPPLSNQQKNQGNKFYIVSIMRMNANLSKPIKVYYVYEMTRKGLLVQKHGSEPVGEPFQSTEAAKRWINKMQKYPQT